MRFIILLCFIIAIALGGTQETRALPFHLVKRYDGTIPVFNGQHKSYKSFFGEYFND